MKIAVQAIRHSKTVEKKVPMGEAIDGRNKCHSTYNQELQAQTQHKKNDFSDVSVVESNVVSSAGDDVGTNAFCGNNKCQKQTSTDNTMPRALVHDSNVPLVVLRPVVGASFANKVLTLRLPLFIVAFISSIHGRRISSLLFQHSRHERHPAEVWQSFGRMRHCSL